MGIDYWNEEFKLLGFKSVYPNNAQLWDGKRGMFVKEMNYQGRGVYNIVALIIPLRSHLILSASPKYVGLSSEVLNGSFLIEQYQDRAFKVKLPNTIYVGRCENSDMLMNILDLTNTLRP